MSFTKASAELLTYAINSKFNRGEPASPVHNIMNTLIGASSSNQQQQAGQSNHNQAPKGMLFLILCCQFFKVEHFFTKDVKPFES